MAAPNGEHLPRLGANARDDRLFTTVNREPTELREHPAEARDRHADRRAADRQARDRRDAAAGDDHLPSAAPTELITVSPCRELGSQRLADPNELRAVRQLGEPDLGGRDASARIAV